LECVRVIDTEEAELTEKTSHREHKDTESLCLGVEEAELTERTSHREHKDTENLCVSVSLWLIILGELMQAL